jgi:hypothetical protein
MHGREPPPSLPRHPSHGRAGTRAGYAPPAGEPRATSAGEDQGEAGPRRPRSLPHRPLPATRGHLHARAEGVGSGFRQAGRDRCRRLHRMAECSRRDGRPRWGRGKRSAGGGRPEWAGRGCERQLAGRAEERQWVHVAPSRSLSADADVKPSVPARARRGAQPRAAPYTGATADGERAQRQVRDAPCAAPHADGRAVGAGSAREDHAPGAGRAHPNTRTGREVSAAVAAGRERAVVVVERAGHRAWHRPLPSAGRRRCGRCGTADRHTGHEDGGYSPPPARPARRESSRGAERGHGVDARGRAPGSGQVSRYRYEEVAKVSRSPRRSAQRGRPAME